MSSEARPRLSLMNRAEVRRKNWLLGVATLMPIAYLIIFAALIIGASVAGGGDPDDHLAVSHTSLTFAHGIALCWIAGLLVIYIRDVIINPAVRPEQRGVWIALLVIGNVPIMLVYWWIYLGPAPAKSMWRAEA